VALEYLSCPERNGEALRLERKVQFFDNRIACDGPNGSIPRLPAHLNRLGACVRKGKVSEVRSIARIKKEDRKFPVVNI
jgi:hypothetical protein